MGLIHKMLDSVRERVCLSVIVAVSVFAITVFCVTLSCRTAAASGEGLEKPDIHYDRTVLEQGRLQTFTYEYPLVDGATGKRVVGILLINAPPAMVWRALEDWESMPEFVSDLKYYKTVYVEPSPPNSPRTVAYIEGELKIAFFSILYNLRVVFDRQNLWQKWNLVDEDEEKKLKAKGVSLSPSSSFLRSIRGFGYIEPYGDGSRTVYYYAPVVEVSIPVPGWIERRIAKSSLTEYMEGLKKKVEGEKASIKTCGLTSTVAQ